MNLLLASLRYDDLVIELTQKLRHFYFVASQSNWFSEFDLLARFPEREKMFCG